MDYKQLLTIWGIPIAVSVILAVTLVGVFHIGGKQVTTTVVNPATGQPEQVVGSVAGPDIPFPYLRWGNLGPVWNTGMAMNATSSVFCSIQLPAGTSTISFLSTRIDNVGTMQTSNIFFDVSTSSTQFGSSTPAFISGETLASTSSFWFPSSTSTTASRVGVLNPGMNANTDGSMSAMVFGSSAATPLYLNWRVATSAAGTYTNYPTGQCQAQFIQL